MEGMEAEVETKLFVDYSIIRNVCYATDLRSKTQGRGTYAMEPSHYEEVPKSVLDAIVASVLKKKIECVGAIRSPAGDQISLQTYKIAI